MTTGDAGLDAIIQAELERLHSFLEDIHREWLEAAAILEDMIQAECERVRPFLEGIQRQAVESMALLDDVTGPDGSRAAGRGDNRHT